jgi:hypothetical protein
MSFEALGRHRPLNRFEPALTPTYTHCLRWILGDSARNGELADPLKNAFSEISISWFFTPYQK